MAAAKSARLVFKGTVSSDFNQVPTNQNGHKNNNKMLTIKGEVGHFCTTSSNLQDVILAMAYI